MFLAANFPSIQPWRQPRTYSHVCRHVNFMWYSCLLVYVFVQMITFTQMTVVVDIWHGGLN